jgi:peptidoglycan/LPS O-acetylase OafA/YrhL
VIRVRPLEAAGETSGTTREPGAGYRRDIDGIRALAIVPVVLYHAGVGRLTGGFVGVDVFFVLSGYLITGIVQRDIDAGRFSIARFYARRARRILPALYLVLAGTMALGVLVLLPGEVRSLGKMTVATCLFVSNVMFWRESGYFDAGAEMNPLLMTWSLGVEEQFYLIWPLALAAAARHRRGARWLVGLGGAASLAVAVIQVARSPDAAFFLAPGRAWELLLGAALAVRGSSRPGLDGRGRLRDAASWGGLGLVLGAVFLFGGETPFPGAAALLPCLGTALLIWAGEGAWVNRRVLSRRPLVFIGLISYSLYLWHWPLISLARQARGGELGTPLALVLVALSLGLAYASWRFVEQPFRRGASARPTRILAGFGAATAALCGVATLLFETRGLPRGATPVAAAAEAARLDVNPMRAACHRDPASEEELDGRCVVSGPSGTLVALWGDSHADALAPGVLWWARQQGQGFVQLTASSCPPLPGVHPVGRRVPSGCEGFNERALAFIASEPRISVVVAAARWAYYTENGPFGRESGAPVYLEDGTTPEQTREHGRSVFRGGLEALVERVAATGKRLAIVSEIPEVGVHVPDCLLRRELLPALQALAGPGPSCGAPAEQVAGRLRFVEAELEALAMRHPSLLVLPPFAVLCGSGECLTRGAGEVLYVDDNHLSSAGAVFLVRHLADPLSRAVAAQQGR